MELRHRIMPSALYTTPKIKPDFLKISREASCSIWANLNHLIGFEVNHLSIDIKILRDPSALLIPILLKEAETDPAYGQHVLKELIKKLMVKHLEIRLSENTKSDYGTKEVLINLKKCKLNVFNIWMFPFNESVIKTHFNVGDLNELKEIEIDVVKIAAVYEKESSILIRFVNGISYELEFDKFDKDSKLEILGRIEHGMVNLTQLII